MLGLCLLFIHPPAHGSEVSPAARNTLDSARIPRASKLLICGLFQKVRVLAQDGGHSWRAGGIVAPFYFFLRVPARAVGFLNEVGRLPGFLPVCPARRLFLASGARSSSETPPISMSTPKTDDSLSDLSTLPLRDLSPVGGWSTAASTISAGSTPRKVNSSSGSWSREGEEHLDGGPGA